MSVAQKLYEGVELKSGSQGLITYMRTDGIYIAQEAVDSIRDLVLDKFGKDYLPQSPVKFKKKVKNAQEAHESIRPTDILLTPEDVKPYLTADQIKLYSIIWQRTVASQMSDAVINSGSILLVSECGQFAFYASCSQLKFDGFYKAYPYSRDGIVNADVAEFIKWAECNQDSRLDIKNIGTKQNFTEPPRRYSEAGLIKKMEELGIGRPSTYATIISVLQDRLYALIQNKSFIPEARGRVVAAFLSKFFARYVEYTFTADLESDLDKVADGALDWMSLIKGFWKDFNQNVKEVDQIPIKDVLQTINTEIKDQQIIKSDAKIGDQCTKCKKGKLALNVGKFGVFLACDQYPDCKNTLNSRDDMNEQEEFPKNITEEITLNKGPYGIYLKYQDKNFSIPKDLKIEDINQELAKNLVSMPRVLGLHPKDGLEIKIGSGPYGLYILHNKKYYNFSTQELQCINLEKAVNIIDTKKTNTQEALKELGQKDGKDVTIKEGRYGPYIKYEKLNVAIPKNMKIDDITLEDAIELIDKKMQKGTGSKKTNALKKK
jgi:DNA topoisomerase-1